MTRDEAMNALGLSSFCTIDDIEEAYWRQIAGPMRNSLHAASPKDRDGARDAVVLLRDAYFILTGQTAPQQRKAQYRTVNASASSPRPRTHKPGNVLGQVGAILSDLAAGAADAARRAWSNIRPRVTRKVAVTVVLIAISVPAGWIIIANIAGADTHSRQQSGLTPAAVAAPIAGRQSKKTQVGYLVVKTTPWCRVYVDSKYVADAPWLQGKSLAVGTHTVSMKTITGKTYQQQVNIQADTIATITHRFSNK